MGARPGELPPLTPMEPGERFRALDVLRGVAVLGILVMNLRVFALPQAEFDDPSFPSGTLTWANGWAWGVGNVLFEDKFIAIFSVLFGAGIVVMNDRAVRAGLNAAWLHSRRMAWLFVIGIVHAYGLWHGDILNTYALCGAALYPLRRLHPALLIGLGAVCLMVTVGVRVGPGLYGPVLAPTPVASTAPQTPESWRGRIWRETSETEAAAHRGSYAEHFRWRARLNTLWHFDAGVRFSLWRSWGYMLIGMGLLRLGVLTGEGGWRSLAGLAIAGYAIGLTLALAGFAPQLARVVGAMPEMTGPARRMLGSLAWAARFLGAAGVALGHVGVVLLVCRGLAGSRVLEPVAAVGRMALTSYLTHTIVCALVFYSWGGWGLGLWGTWGMAAQFGLAAGVWAAQLVVSPLWLRWFRFGPAEWAWRSLTYGRVQAWRRRGGTGDAPA